MADHLGRVVQPSAGQPLITPTNPVTLSVMPSTNLTPRQGEVLALLLEGRTNKEIARTLAISPFTARAHVAAVMQYFGATRRQDLPALCQSTLDDRIAIASGTPLPPQLLPSMPRPAVWRPWLAGITAFVALAMVVAVVATPDAEPGSAWAAAKVAPEALILKSVAGTADTEIRIDTINMPQIDSRDAFLEFAKSHLTSAMAQQRLRRHRFEPLRIDDVDCLAYAGVSPPASVGSTITYTHAKGYLCRHPGQPDAAIRIGAFAEGRTRDFADADAVRAVLRDLLEKTAATG